MTQTTFDLSTLSDITDGAHTVKVKAKADGYNDSEFSNEVSYTKTPIPIGHQFWYMKYFTYAKSVNNGVDIYFYNASNERIAYVEFWWDKPNKVLKGRINEGDETVGDYNDGNLQLKVDFKAVKCTARPWGSIERAYAGYDYRDNRVSLPIDATTEVDILNWDSTFAVSTYDQ